MNSLVLLLFLLGIIFITIGYTKSSVKCPPPKIQYRFIPRSFYEEQLAPDNITSTFQDMFNQDSPWYNYYQGSIESKNNFDNNYDNFFSVDNN